MLLVLAALFTRSMTHVARADVGTDVDRLVTVSTRLGASDYDAPRANRTWQRVVEQVIELPGVERAALADYPPFSGAYRAMRTVRDGRTYEVGLVHVSADYFATTGINVLRGRTFTETEVATGAPVAVITERAARWLWSGEDALGATLARIADDMPGEEVRDVRIIGIVADAQMRLQNPGESAGLYRPLAPAESMRARLVVRARGDAGSIVGPVSQAIRAVDPSLLPAAESMRDGIADARRPLLAIVSGAIALGVVALLLATIGVFGVTAFAVEQRTGEMGVRLAVGATASDIVRLMLRDSLRPVAIGLAIGLLLAAAMSRLLGALLFGISPNDPLSIIAATVVLIGASALAAIVPTRRAGRIDPAEVLRRD
jgi:predicted permease